MLGYTRWRTGTYIQYALPDLSDTDRETLMTGLCAACQVSYFSDEIGLSNDHTWIGIQLPPRHPLPRDPDQGQGADEPDPGGG